ncbi:hypothetical protein DFH94DRAFT_789798, partial [Russula ochroleuca]
MATSFSPTHGEVALVNQIFAKARSSKVWYLKIWGIADEDNQGYLTRKGVSVAVRLTVAELVKNLALSPSWDGFSSSSEPRRA